MGGQLLLASLFLIAASLIPLASSACSDLTTLKLCYNTYFENFEIATDPFPEYRAYKMLREMLLVEEGPSGQTKECGFQNALISCLSAQENDCVSTPVFASTFNISNEEATNFVQDYYMMKYTCNAGYSDAMKYFYCLEQVGLYHTNSLINCSTDEQNSLANGVGCSAYNDYVGCLTTVYIANCGADIQKYICNLEVSGISKAAPDCASSLPTCTQSSSSTISRQFIPRAAGRKFAMANAAKKVLVSGRFVFP